MKVHYPFLFVSLFTIHTNSTAQSLSTALIRAYHHLLELKVDWKDQITEKEYDQGSDETFKIYTESLCDFLSLTLRHDDSLYQTYINREKKHLDELDELNENDEFISFVKAEIKLHAAIIRFRYNDQFSGAIRLIQSYNIVKTKIENENTPVYFYKTAGVLNILLSIVPDKYDFFLNLIGIHAELSTGVQQLKKINETYNLFQFEGQMILALLNAYYLNDPEKSAIILNENRAEWQHGLLYQYLNGLVFMKIRDNDKAILAFSSCTQFKGDHMEIPSSTFYLAESFLKKLDYSLARENYLKYLSLENNDDFVKASYYKLSLISLFNNEIKTYESYREKVLTEGTVSTEADNYAYKLIKNNYQPHPEIQKARLLFDGGYYDQSLNILKSIQGDKLNAEEKLEFNYRSARAYQLQKNYSKATHFFEKMFEMTFQDHYLVANAHLQMGYMLYELGNKDGSERQFREALRYSGEFYKESIRNEAKAGLSLMED